MCDIRTCLLWLNSSSVGVDATPNCVLRNRDHALCMMSTRFLYNSGGLFKESHTVTRDRSISITSRIQWKLLIHTYGYKKCQIYTLIWLVEVTKKSKDSLEVTRKQNECVIVLPFQGHKYIILGLIRILAYTLLMYNIRIDEA